MKTYLWKPSSDETIKTNDVTASKELARGKEQAVGPIAVDNKKHSSIREVSIMQENSRIWEKKNRIILAIKKIW